MSAFVCPCGVMRKLEQVFDGEWWYMPECPGCGSPAYKVNDLETSPDLAMFVPPPSGLEWQGPGDDGYMWLADPNEVSSP